MVIRFIGRDLSQDRNRSFAQGSFEGPPVFTKYLRATNADPSSYELLWDPFHLQEDKRIRYFKSVEAEFDPSPSLFFEWKGRTYLARPAEKVVLDVATGLNADAEFDFANTQ